MKFRIFLPVQRRWFVSCNIDITGLETLVLSRHAYQATCVGDFQAASDVAAELNAIGYDTDAVPINPLLS